MTSFAADEGPRLLRGGPIARRSARRSPRTSRRSAGVRHAPALAVVIVGRDAPSAVYLHKILDGCRLVGSRTASSSCRGRRRTDTGAGLRELNADSDVAGIIVQMPLPPGIRLRAVIDALDPAKDIDGIHPLNAGLLALGYDGFLPATAHAAVEILKRSGIELTGNAVVVGRSNVVGKPAALLLLRENATVTSATARPRPADVIPGRTSSSWRSAGPL